LIGRLTADPEVRYTNNNTAIANFSVAINRGKDKNGADKGTDYPRIVVFGKQAENCQKFLAKGRQVGIEGRIQTGSYTDKKGDRVYTTDVIASRVEFIGSSTKNADSSSQSSAGASQDAAQVEFTEIPDDIIPF
jgi:single-strand DNA-binding protein